ncbi:MAG: hypothetical protein ABFC94_13180 [Syntrophomonas sp.]
MANAGSKGVSNEELMDINRKWLQEKKAELKLREDEIKKLQEECKEIRQAMDPIETWLARMGKREQMPESDLTGPEKETAAGPGYKELRGDRLRNEVVELLREVYPDMLYYRVILQRLQERGYEVGGKDPGLNLIAHISKDKRIKRGDKRGIYRLDESYLNAGESGESIRD